LSQRSNRGASRGRISVVSRAAASAKVFDHHQVKGRRITAVDHTAPVGRGAQPQDVTGPRVERPDLAVLSRRRVPVARARGVRTAVCRVGQSMWKISRGSRRRPTCQHIPRSTARRRRLSGGQAARHLSPSDSRACGRRGSRRQEAACLRDLLLGVASHRDAPNLVASGPIRPVVHEPAIVRPARHVRVCRAVRDLAEPRPVDADRPDIPPTVPGLRVEGNRAPVRRPAR